MEKLSSLRAGPGAKRIEDCSETARLSRAIWGYGGQGLIQVKEYVGDPIYKKLGSQKTTSSTCTQKQVLSTQVGSHCLPCLSGSGSVKVQIWFRVW